MNDTTQPRGVLVEARNVLGDGTIVRVLIQSAMILGEPEDRQSIEITARRLAKQARYDQYIPGTFVIQAALHDAWNQVLPGHTGRHNIYLEELIQEVLEAEEDLHKGMVFTPTDQLYRWYFGYAAINQLRYYIEAQHPMVAGV